MEDTIDRRRSLPPGGTIERRTAACGWPMRVAIWADGARGTLLFLNGRGDFIEKYAEALWHFRDRGWAVIAPDWRGQGGSGRLGRTPRHGHTADFAPWLADLRGIIGGLGALPKPHVAVAHSMGGHILVRALAEGEQRLDRVVLTAPMLGIAAPVPAWLAAAIARAMPGPAFLPGEGRTRTAEAEARRAAILTSDVARGTDEGWWLARHPALGLGGPSWGWLAAAYASIATLARPGALEAVATPLIALLAADERVVSNAAAIRAVARMPGGAYRIVAGRHELLREADPARTAALAAIDRFMEQA